MFELVNVSVCHRPMFELVNVSICHVLPLQLVNVSVSHSSNFETSEFAFSRVYHRTFASVTSEHKMEVYTNARHISVTGARKLGSPA